MRGCALLCLLAAGCAPGGGDPPPLLTMAAGVQPVVRVHLASLGAWTRLEIMASEGLRVSADGRTLPTRELLVLRRAGEGTILVEGLSAPVERLQLDPLGGTFHVGIRAYAGSLAWRDGRLLNLVRLEDYVLGVLRGELPVRHVPRAAAAAQAVAIRSYTLHYLAAGSATYDVDDTVQFQCYVGLRRAPEDENLVAAAKATEGWVLVHEGRPLKAYYHSTCGGHTADASTGLDRKDAPGMRGVPCGYCRKSPYWRWETRLESALLVRASGLDGPLERFEIAERDAGGRARRVRVVAGGRTATLHAGEFRLRTGPSVLRSTMIFSVERAGDGIRFAGGGWGHGVGLCQLGAVGLADEGRTAAGILAYYYPQATLRRP